MGRAPDSRIAVGVPTVGVTAVSQHDCRSYSPKWPPFRPWCCNGNRHQVGELSRPNRHHVVHHTIKWAPRLKGLHRIGPVLEHLHTLVPELASLIRLVHRVAHNLAVLCSECQAGVSTLGLQVVAHCGSESMLNGVKPDGMHGHT